MRMNILSINFMALRDAIINNSEYRYIIMNEETLKMFRSEGNAKPLFKNTDVFYYYGIPVAICNELTVGQVELVR